MGNCSRKLRRKLNSWYFSNNNGTLRIDRDMYCPKCNQHFRRNTTYSTVNYHLDNCLATQESFTTHTSTSFGGVNLGQINFVVSSNPAMQSEKYVWIKKTGPNNVVVWEKIPSKLTKTISHVENMSTKSAKDLNFEDKEMWFKSQLDKFRIHWTYGADFLNVSVHNLLETARKNMKKVNLHKEVKIIFDEEKKVNDAGGLLREFIHLFCLEVFSAERGLFIRADTPETIYRINPKAPDSSENLELFKLVGQIVGKALFEQITIPAQLDRLLLKQIVQKDFSLEDLLTFDKQLYNSLNHIQEITINGCETFEEYFIIYSPVDGSQVQLIPNGEHVQITDQNKGEYIKHKLEWLGRKFIQKKVEAILVGLYQVIPPEIFKAFTVEEIEMLINGLPFIDINDWETNTVYKGSYTRNHQVVKWFWEAMKELNQEQLSKFFHFCTGSSKPPVEGFRALQSNRGEFQKFTIESVKYSHDEPGLSAHTCFNRLELPMYSKKEVLKENIMNVMKADFNGVFGIE